MHRGIYFLLILFLSSAGAFEVGYISDQPAPTHLIASVNKDNFDFKSIPTRDFLTTLRGIERADALLIDISPKNGPNLTADTAWLIGFAFAKAKPLFLWTRDGRRFSQRVQDEFHARNQHGFSREADGFKRLMDPDGYAVEEFDLWENLMIDGAAYHSRSEIATSAEAAFLPHAAALRKRLAMNGQPRMTTDLFRPSDLIWDVNSGPNKNIYLAGPDVFLPAPHLAAELKKRIALNYGYRGMFPLDNAVTFSPDPHEFAMRIFYANIQTMLNSQIILANMTPFRGRDMDQGTAFEQGFMFALGNVVLGYSSLGTMDIGRFPLRSLRGESLAHSFSDALTRYVNLPLESAFREEENAIAFCASLLTSK